MQRVHVKIPHLYWGRSSSCTTQRRHRCDLFLKNGPTSASFSFIFVFSNQHSRQILQQINVKDVHPVYGTGI